MKKKPIVVKKCNVDGFILYSNDRNQGITLSSSDRLEIFKHCSNIYPGLIQEISKKICDRFEMQYDIVESIVRHTIIPLLNVFIITTVKVGAAVNSEKELLGVIKTHCDLQTKTIEEFTSKAKLDSNFNQYLIYKVSSIWDLEELNYSVDYNSSNVKTHNSDYVNYMSRLYPRTVFYALINRARKILYKIQGIFFLKKIPITSTSYLSIPFEHRGMFSRYFNEINVDTRVSNCNKNKDIRNYIFNHEIIRKLDFNYFFSKLNLTNVQKNSFVENFSDFLKHFYPVNSLELMPEIIDLINPQISKYSNSILVTGSGINTNNCYLSALLREKGIKLVRLQHGGYTGYYQYGYHYDYMWSNEFDMCDYYLTWGWVTPHNKLDRQKIKFIPFVSPWLSERKKYWKHRRIEIKRNYEFDILMAPTRLSAFHTPNWQNPVDDIEPNSKLLVSAVKELTNASVSILYKAPSIYSMEAYSYSLKKMISVGGKYFRVLENIDKGLDINLLNRVSLVLWDVVGFGFLECISCGIPTMILLVDFSNIESDAKKILLRMERAGIVHTNPMSLANEFSKYKQDRKKWMENKERKSVIKDFSNLYSNTNSNWNKDLIKIIQELKH